MRYGYSLPERLDFFQGLISNPLQNSKGKWKVPLGGRFQDMDIYEVSNELPKYRLDNTRTLYLQEQFIFEQNKDDDFFTDVESDKVQEIQHNLLKKLITSTDKEKDLLSYFTKTEQTEPLILTDDGFVISGNRRLCTYRELLEENYEKNKRYSSIRVVILPKLNAEQIDQIEDYLEQQTDIKESFSWVSRAIGYRRRMQKYNYSDDQLAKITGQKKAEISSLINKLEIADRYLESINKQKDYNQILDDFYAFEKIYACEQKNKGNIIKTNAFEKLAFLAIKNKGSFSDRMYKNIPIIHEAQALIHNELSDEFEHEIKQLESNPETNDSLAGLKIFPDPAISIIKLVAKPELEEKIIEIVSDKIEEFLALEREKKKKSSVLDRVRKANTLLIEANAIKSHETDKSGVLSQINNIQKELEKLKGWVSQK